jgi:UDP-glucose 4-epimerase
MAYRKALVTGGAGFIGGHHVRALLERGVRVAVIDDLSMGKRDNVPPEAEFVLGNIGDTALVRQALTGVDVVFHLAARVTIRGSMDHFAEDAQTNVMGTLSVLQACAHSSVRKFILASSMAVYADAPTPAPLPETYTTEPLSPYGVSKLASEHYVRLVCGAGGFEHVGLRFFNTYGPGQGLTPYVGVMTIFCNRLLAGEPPLIFGDGEQCRDFVYVGDIVQGCLLAMERGQSGSVYNIGSGRGTTVNALADMLCRRISPRLSALHQAAHAGEVRNSVADITRAQTALGYRPQGHLESQLDDIIAWNAARR